MINQEKAGVVCNFLSAKARIEKARYCQQFMVNWASQTFSVGLWMAAKEPVTRHPNFTGRLIPNSGKLDYPSKGSQYIWRIIKASPPGTRNPLLRSYFPV